jgi:hypothetical protein
MKWLLKKYMAEAHIETIAELADITGIPKRTLFERIRNPSALRLYEVEAMDKVLKFNDCDIVKMIRGKR